LTATTAISIRYVGFESTLLGRDYTLLVRQGELSSRVTVRIPHAAFSGRLTRFQDAPDICFLKVQSELALRDNQAPAPEDTLVVTDVELAAYRTAHEKAPGGRRAKPAAQVEHR
jgi:hypothetical protein